VAANGVVVMPVQMLVGGVEIQMRLSGSAAVADGPYSFSSRFALMSTFSPGAIACAAPLMVHTSLKNSDGDCAKTTELSDRPTRAARIRLIMGAIIQRPQNGPDSRRNVNLSPISCLRLHTTCGMLPPGA